MAAPTPGCCDMRCIDCDGISRNDVNMEFKGSAEKESQRDNSQAPTLLREILEPSLQREKYATIYVFRTSRFASVVTLFKEGESSENKTGQKTNIGV